MFSADAGNSNTNGVEVALEQIFEMRVPFELIAAQEGSRIRLRFAIWREHLPWTRCRWKAGSICTRCRKRNWRRTCIASRRRTKGSC